MAKPKPNERPRKPQNKKLDPEIKKAIFAGLFVIVGAVISSIIGPIIIEKYTQTPEPTILSQPESLLAVNPTQVSLEVITSTVQSSSTIPIQPSITSSLPATNTQSITNVPIEANLYLPEGSCLSIAPPSTVDFETEPEKAVLLASSAMETGEADSWPIVGGGFLHLRISNVATETDWVEIENSINVIITSISSPSEHIYAVLTGMECGGGGEIRQFSQVNFSREYDSYSLRTSSLEFDFFTLQPGEFELFQIPFICQSTGIFTVSLEIPYKIRNSNGVYVSSANRPFICPNAYTDIGIYEGNIIHAQMFAWDGQQYVGQVR